MIQDATIRVILFKSKTLANGEHPLMLVVTKDGKRKYSALGLSCHPEQWNFQKNEPKKNHPNKLKIEAIINKRINELQTKLLDFKLSEKPFTPESLVATSKKPKGTADVFAYMDQLIEGFTVRKQIGNANVYYDTQSALKRFLPKTKTLAFVDIDLNFLNRLETYFRSRNIAETSMSFYFRTLRAVYNKAIKDKIIGQQYYPFKDFLISKFNTETRKRAISKADMRTIEAVDVSESFKMQLAKDVFLFSYYTQGMNLTDIAFMKWGVYVQDRIFYTRAKTGKDFNLKLLEPARQILERYRLITGGNSENYIFPILNAERHITPVQIDNRIHKLTGEINKHLKSIARLAAIEVPLTTYVARHSYGTVLKNSGVSIAVISEAMGHKSEAVTRTYLKGFENEVIEAANENLL